ncbi:bifunctional Ribosomal protein S9/Ribosomal protein S9 [Babesia duncani]|uniref:Bifunctional Ribosomal protein S9/Ribosomal protein S9 n=1 Tax=Babesia duncani TaxID=323732 RepID=A0AAD9PJL6_9APIC|nr:bifunctional Ribosomal protein S9/Ribosomal protein S9 [Babesia duncani]
MEAAWLAAEAGIITKKEIQTQVIRAPSFSPDKTPFLIQDLFQTRNRPLEQHVQQQSQAEKPVPIIKYESDPNLGPVEQILSTNTPADVRKLFWHAGAWWRTIAQGSGTCCRSTAWVKIIRGSGQVIVNNNEDVYWRWHRFYNRMDVLEPLYLANVAGTFDVYIALSGGGTSGQAKAARVALARALLDSCPECQGTLASALVEDIRQKMPKMPGRIGARAQRKWRKR